MVSHSLKDYFFSVDEQALFADLIPIKAKHFNLITKSAAVCRGASFLRGELYLLSATPSRNEGWRLFTD